MNKKLTAWILTGALACTLTVPAMAAETTAVPISAPISAEEQTPLPYSVLYYGTVQEVVYGEDGAIERLHLDSERYGEYVMNVSAQTLWIDSGEQKAADPAAVKKGNSIYVFHSNVVTDSLPPQSAAYVVVRNIPMDVGCAQFHTVEEVSMENGRLTITTDHGGLHIRADEKTGLSQYEGSGTVALDEIQPGDRIMAWYNNIAESYPAQTYANHLMLLPDSTEESNQTLTRGAFLSMLHEKEGKPVVNYAMQYTDVSEGDPYAEAIRWATSEKLAGGFGDGSFGPDEALSREQLVTILWRYAGSPMLMDYPGLSEFSDIDQLSLWAQPAMAWAHQNGYISALEGDRLAPQANADMALAESMLKALDSNS